MLKEVDFESVGEMHGGRLQFAFNEAVNACVKDCVNLPNVSGARSVTLVLSIKPIPLKDGGDLERCVFSASVSKKLAKRETEEFTAEIRFKDRQPLLAYNDMSGDEPRQRTIDELIKPTERDVEE